MHHMSKAGGVLPLTRETATARRAKPAGGAWKGLLKPVLNSAARRALTGRRRSALRPEAGRFSRPDVERVLRRLWRIYDELSPGIPRQPTLGTRMNVRLAAATVAAHRALVKAGVEESEAADLVADIAWVIYEKWGSIPRLISRIATRNPLRRMAIATSLFRRFPFNPPGYVMEDVAADDMVAFDVRHCPISDYFKSQGLPDVCVATWCNQDYSLAELWGGKFERGGTLVEGAERCDMRWIPTEVGPPGGNHA